MTGNWIIDNLIHALNVWNSKLSEIWGLLTQSPASFKGGIVWQIIVNIHGALMATGLALLVLFFVVGLAKKCSSLTDIKKPEHALRLFIRFVLAKSIVTYGMDLLLAIFAIVQGIISTIISNSNMGAGEMILPDSIMAAIKSCNFFEAIPLWMVTFLGGLFITVMSFTLIMTVYARFFKLYIYTALSPIPLAALASESTQSSGIAFLKSYTAACAEGAVIAIACVIYTAFAASPSVLEGVSAVTMVWGYIAELIFNMLVLVGTIKIADRIVKEMAAL